LEKERGHGQDKPKDRRDSRLRGSRLYEHADSNKEHRDRHQDAADKDPGRLLDRRLMDNRAEPDTTEDKLKHSTD